MLKKFKVPTFQGLTPIFGLPLNDEPERSGGDKWVADLDETTGILYTFSVFPWPLFLAREDVPE